MSCDNVTPLMYVEVAAIVPPTHQAYFRCAGTKGADAYEEVVARVKTLLYIEHTDDDAVPHHAPITYPVPKKRQDVARNNKYTMNNPPPDQEKQEEYTSILVVHDAFLSGRMMLYELDTKPIRRMRYIGGPEVTTICALPEGYGWDLATPYMIGYAGSRSAGSPR